MTVRPNLDSIASSWEIYSKCYSKIVVHREYKPFIYSMYHML